MWVSCEYAFTMRGLYQDIIPIIIFHSAVSVSSHHTDEGYVHNSTDYVADKRHIVMRLAWFPIAFEGVHPFIGGNGRTGRLLVNLELMKAGLPPIDIKFTDRIAYYDAFDAFHVKHDLSAMERLFARYVNERLDSYLAMLTV